MIANRAKNLLSVPSAVVTESGVSADVNVAALDKFRLDISVTALAGTDPTIRFYLDSKGADGVYRAVYDSTAKSAPAVFGDVFGPVAADALQDFWGPTVRLRWVVTGSDTEVDDVVTEALGITFSASLQGKAAL